MHNYQQQHTGDNDIECSGHQRQQVEESVLRHGVVASPWQLKLELQGAANLPGPIAQKFILAAAPYHSDTATARSSQVTADTMVPSSLQAKGGGSIAIRFTQQQEQEEEDCSNFEGADYFDDNSSVDEETEQNEDLLDDAAQSAGSHHTTQLGPLPVGPPGMAQSHLELPVAVGMVRVQRPLTSRHNSIFTGEL